MPSRPTPDPHRDPSATVGPVAPRAVPLLLALAAANTASTHHQLAPQVLAEQSSTPPPSALLGLGNLAIWHTDLVWQNQACSTPRNCPRILAILHSCSRLKSLGTHSGAVKKPLHLGAAARFRGGAAWRTILPMYGVRAALALCQQHYIPKPTPTAWKIGQLASRSEDSPVGHWPAHLDPRRRPQS